jgi:hypothetical protein
MFTSLHRGERPAWPREEGGREEGGASSAKTAAKCVQGLRSGPAALTSSAARSCALCLRTLIFTLIFTTTNAPILVHLRALSYISLRVWAQEHSG